MNLFKLFAIFAKIGATTFGGGYAMLPILQREIVDNYKLANNVLAAGVTKIGTSSGHIIMDQLNHVLDNQKVDPNQKTGPRLI